MILSASITWLFVTTFVVLAGLERPLPVNGDGAFPAAYVFSNSNSDSEPYNRRGLAHTTLNRDERGRVLDGAPPTASPTFSPFLVYFPVYQTMEVSVVCV